MTKNIKKLLIVLGILVVIAVVVIVLPKLKSTPKSALVSKTVTTNIPINSPDPSKEFVSLLQSIKSITLDTTLVQSKAFKMLINHSTLLPENAPSGRPNPFAIIGEDTVIIKQTEIPTTSPNKETQKTQSTTEIDSSIYEIDSLLNGL